MERIPNSEINVLTSTLTKQQDVFFFFNVQIKTNIVFLSADDTLLEASHFLLPCMRVMEIYTIYRRMKCANVHKNVHKK